MRADRRELAAIFTGALIGAIARAGLVEMLPSHPSQWPWPTFIANLVGAFLLGYFTTRLQEHFRSRPTAGRSWAPGYAAR